MHKSFDLYFVSSNSHKYKEAKSILDSFGIRLGFFKLNLEEIQSNSLKDIAENKAKDALSKCKKPIIIEDDGLFIDSLNGFPGPYSSYVFKTIGNKGILKLVPSKRNAKFVSIITYCDKKTLKTFDAKLDGTISKSQKGKEMEGKKSRPKEKGLRGLSSKAYEAVLEQKSTTYKEVAVKLLK